MNDVKRTGLVATALDRDWHDKGSTAPPGAIRKQGDTLLMACPGCGRVAAMRVGNPKPTDSPSWIITGDATKPETVSLQPSVNCVGCCGWHGWLENGTYISC